MCMSQCLVSATNMIFLCKFFPFTAMHKAVCFLMILFMAFCVLCAVVGLDKIIEPKNFMLEKYFLQFGFAVIMFSLNVYFMNKVNNEFIDEVFEKLRGKEEYKFILDKLDYSIIIVDDNQTDFVNDKFLHLFKGHIRSY